MTEKITVNLMLEKLEQLIGKKFLPVKESSFSEEHNLMIIIFDTTPKGKGWDLIHEEITGLACIYDNNNDIAALDIYDVKGTLKQIEEVLSKKILYA